MTIIIELKPEVQVALNRQAEAHGVDLGTYAASLLEEAVHPPLKTETTLRKNQLENTLRELAQFSDKIPLLPDEACSRESLYRDHD